MYCSYINTGYTKKCKYTKSTLTIFIFIKLGLQLNKSLFAFSGFGSAMYEKYSRMSKSTSGALPGI